MFEHHDLCAVSAASAAYKNLHAAGTRLILSNSLSNLRSACLQVDPRQPLRREEEEPRQPLREQEHEEEQQQRRQFVLEEDEQQQQQPRRPMRDQDEERQQQQPPRQSIRQNGGDDDEDDTRQSVRQLPDRDPRAPPRIRQVQEPTPAPEQTPEVPDVPEQQQAPLAPATPAPAPVAEEILAGDEAVTVVAELKMVPGFQGDCTAKAVDWTQERASRLLVADMDYKGIKTKIKSALWACDVSASFSGLPFLVTLSVSAAHVSRVPHSTKAAASQLCGHAT